MAEAESHLMGQQTGQPKRVTILGVPVDAVTREEARSRVGAMLDEPRFHLVATPNPEMLVAADRDHEFRALLASADLNLPDGIGLVVWSRLVGKPLPERVAGSDFTLEIAGLCAERGLGLFLVGGELPRVAERAATALKKKFPALKVDTHDGGRLHSDADGKLRAEAGVVEAVRASGATVVLAAFGHGRQEKWLRDNLMDLSNVRLTMGVGGTFDFLAGDLRRAPRLLRRLGLEWLWRLVIEPRRWRRILTAVITFPYLVIRRGIS